MTEAEWLACGNPAMMLDLLSGKASDRKLWLFASGCCRRHWPLMDAGCREAVEVGESYADGRATYDQLLNSSEKAFALRSDVLVGNPLSEAAAIAAAFAVVDTKNGDSALDFRTILDAAKDACDDVTSLAELNERVEARRQTTADAERSAHANLLRDVIGNPFRPVVPGPARLIGAVSSLAHSIYDEREFGRMPELADALEQAGCGNVDILAHCRGPGPHVRGCWVLDLILGKT